MNYRNDTYAPDCGTAARGGAYSDSEGAELPSDDSDSSMAPSRRKGSAKAARSRNGGPRVRTLNRWTQEEHERLAYLVDKWGCEKNWAKVAEEMPGRTGKQCRERWLNHMKPGIVKCVSRGAAAVRVPPQSASSHSGGRQLARVQARACHAAPR